MAMQPMNGQSPLPRILVLDPLHPDGITLLQQHAHVDVIGEPGLTATELAACIGHYDAVINRSRTRIPAAAHGGSSKALLEIVRSIKGLRVTEMPVDNLAHALWERNALAYLVTLNKQGFLLEFDAHQAENGYDGLDVLNDFVDSYGAWGEVERTLVTDVDQLRAQ